VVATCPAGLPSIGCLSSVFKFFAEYTFVCRVFFLSLTSVVCLPEYFLSSQCGLFAQCFLI
jgi:hypothetical protein